MKKPVVVKADLLIDALRRHSGATVLFHTAIAALMRLGQADHKCLDLLMRHGAMPAGELSARSGLTTGAITGVVDRLERRGYVARRPDPHDRRRVIVQPDREKAVADFGPLFERLGQATSSLLERYSVEQIELLVDLLDQTSELLENQTAELRQELVGSGDGSTTLKETT